MTFGPDRTYAFTQRWLDWPGTDDTYPDADELDTLLDRAEDHRNESRNP